MSTATDTAPTEQKAWRARYADKPRPSRAKRPPMPVVDHAVLREQAHADAVAEVARIEDMPHQLDRLEAAGQAVNEATDALDRARAERDRLLVQLSMQPPFITGLRNVAGISQTTLHDIKGRLTERPVSRERDENAAAATRAKIKPARNVTSALRSLADVSTKTIQLEVRRDVLAAYRDPLVVAVAADTDLTTAKIADVVGCSALRVSQIIDRNTTTREGSDA